MKRLIFTAGALLLTLSSSAQISAYPQHIGSSVEGYSLPRTVVEVSVVEEREVIIRGPYARYASQYLGVTGAPMSDRENFSILSASISYTTEPDPSQIYAISDRGEVERVMEWITPTAGAQEETPADSRYSGARLGGNTPFKDVGTSTVMDSGNGLSMNISTAVEKSEEQMAADAAATIFKIRKRRLELLTGEQGENVFGAGLEYALKEMARIEDEYVSLFLGKRYTQKSTKVFRVTPKVGADRIVAFRFSSQSGVQPAEDLSASPVNIEISTIEKPTPAPASKGEKSVRYRVPEMCKITLWDGTTTFDSEIIPVFQRGVIVNAPLL